MRKVGEHLRAWSFRQCSRSRPFFSLGTADRRRPPGSKRYKPAGPRATMLANKLKYPARDKTVWNKKGVHFLPPGGQLVDDGHIQIAVDNQGQGAGNGRGGHHQHVGMSAPWQIRAERWATPKRCCSSATTRPRDAKATSLAISAWVPMATKSISPAASCVADLPLFLGAAGSRSAGRSGRPAPPEVRSSER